MSAIRDAVLNARAAELFDLARHLNLRVQVVRAEGDGFVRLSTGDVAELLLCWAEEAEAGIPDLPAAGTRDEAAE